MSLDEKKHRELEMIAVKIGEDFLKVRERNNGRISLNDHEPEVLDFLRQVLERYFAEKGEKVHVNLKGNEGYRVSVRELMKRDIRYSIS